MSLIFEAKNLHKTYQDQIIPFPKIEIIKDKITIITGKTGIGKTTLLNMLGLMDHIEFTKDSDIKFNISLFNDKKNDIHYKKINKHKEIEHIRNTYFGFMFQQDQLIDTMNGWQNLSMPLLVRSSKITMKEAREKIKKLLIDYKFEDMLENNLMDRSPATYSGGQRQRSSLIRAIIHEPKVLFADEPLASVDEKTAKNIINVLKQKANEGTTIILVIHNTHLNLLKNTDHEKINLEGNE